VLHFPSWFFLSYFLALPNLELLVAIWVSSFTCLPHVRVDIAPRYSSIMNTLGNAVGALAGLAGPLVVSALLDNFADVTAWKLVFFITGAQSVVALIVFYFYQADTIVDVLNNPYKSDNNIKADHGEL
jgi:hypothetical protein